MKTIQKKDNLFFTMDYNLEMVSLEEAVKGTVFLDIIDKVLDNMLRDSDERNLTVTVNMGIKFINRSRVTVMSIHGSFADSFFSIEEWKENVIIFSKLLFKELEKESLILSGSYDQQSIKVHFINTEMIKSISEIDIEE